MVTLDTELVLATKKHTLLKPIYFKISCFRVRMFWKERKDDWKKCKINAEVKEGLTNYHCSCVVPILVKNKLLICIFVKVIFVQLHSCRAVLCNQKAPYFFYGHLLVKPIGETARNVHVTSMSTKSGMPLYFIPSCAKLACSERLIVYLLWFSISLDVQAAWNGCQKCKPHQHQAQKRQGKECLTRLC